MHPKPNQKLFLLIEATILSIFCERHINISSAQIPNCSDGGEFHCGSIQYIAHPFWGGSYPRECGREGFELVCQAGVPMLNISSLSYRVRELNFLNNTLKVAREDLWNTTCPKVLRNTTIDFDLFTYPYKSKDENVTIYFDCTVDQPQVEKPASKFTCDVKSAETFNFFRTGDGSSGPGLHITCSSNIFVPINMEEAQSLENPTASSINILRSALESGFSIQWLQDSPSLPFCNVNVYGSCIGDDGSISKSPCIYQNLCRRDADTPVPSVAPEERQGPPIVGSPKGMLPVQSHGNPPESPSYYPQTEYGMPPLRSPGNNFQTGNGLKARKNPAKEIVIVVPLSIIGAIIVSITIRCFLKKRHSASGPNPVCKQNLENFLVQHGSLTPKRYKYSQIKKITKSFGDKLGQGGYGCVYKGMLPDGCLVAVKVLIETDSNGEEFINEVASISRTSHVNIISLLGFCYEGKKRALVYEFMPNKSLDKFLNNNGSRGDENCCLDLEKLYKIIVGIAKGLEYLHMGCSTRIVHFDIKPQNILLDEDFCPKISDFGLAKLCKKKQSILSVLGTRGTIGYIAPEIFSRNFGGVSHKSDVYSYGMMVLEMVGAREIVKADVMQSSENYFPDKIYEQVIADVTKKLDDFIIEDEEETIRKMFLIGFWCIQTSPLDRPSMSKVVEMLEGSLQSIQIPPKPFLFSPNLPGQKFSSSFSEYIEIENSVED